jgi:hypothetical protein
MTRRVRRNHSPAYKAKVALAASKGEKTLAYLARQLDVHVDQITQWKGSSRFGSMTPTTIRSNCSLYSKSKYKKTGTLLHSEQLDSTKSPFGAKLFLIICSALAVALATSSEKMPV